MRSAALFLLVLTGSLRADKIVSFRPQEIATDLSIGYAVHLVDLNGDRKPDILVVDKHRVIWYENPTWQRHTILQGKTKPDNVCITSLDIDGDGKLDLVLGADWAPFNTQEGGTLHWLKQPDDITQEWAMFPITTEPTVHRVRTADIDGDGKEEIILMPLMGRGSSKAANWMDGRPVRTLAFAVPKNPRQGPWLPIVLDESLHVVHNFMPIPQLNGSQTGGILTASYEGVNIIEKTESGWRTRLLGVGNQATPNANRGASEIKLGKLKNAKQYIATIEPWHGNQVVVYTEPKDPKGLWDRHVIDDRLQWGHAVWCADLDGDGNDELIIGVRDNLGKSPATGERCGIRVYRATDDRGVAWERQILEDGGVAVEDLAVADLNGDGKPDIVAVGRATRNARIYWNTGRE